MKPVLLLCSNFLFASKIVETARQLGVELVQVKDELADGADGAAFDRALVDLNHPAALPSISSLRGASETLRIVAFVQHDDVESIRAARDAGASEVLARSAFVQRLPSLLKSPPNGADGVSG